MTEGGGSEVAQVRMEGKIDRLNDKVERFQADVIDLRDRQHGLSNRVGVLEADKHLRDGERRGATAVVKVIPWLTSAGVVALIAFIARSLGV